MPRLARPFWLVTPWPGPAQIVLGPETLALVGGHVGGTVRVFNGKTTLIMRVAGTATMPAIGVGHGIHSSLGGGAVLSASALPRDQLNAGVSSRSPAISMVTVAVVAMSALALAILTAIVPGWSAAQTSIAAVLRTE